MNPINTWLDPIEVRRQADLLMKPKCESTAPPPDAAFGKDFIGYESDSFAPVQVVHAPAAPPARLPVEIQTTARVPLIERISSFRDWIRRDFSATDIFILDREGTVIFDESNHGRLHFLARSFALAPRRSGASAGNVHLKICAGATLELIPVETYHGRFILGALVPEALTPPSVKTVMEALAQVAAPSTKDLESKL